MKSCINQLADWYQKQVKKSPEKNQFDEFIISVKHEFLISADSSNDS